MRESFFLGLDTIYHSVINHSVHGHSATCHSAFRFPIGLGLFFLPFGILFPLIFPSRPLEMAGTSTTEEGSVLATLLAEQEQRMSKMDSKDSLETCVQKTMRKRKLLVDPPMSMTNVRCMRTSWVWPLLIQESPQSVCSALQLFFRATWPSATFLVAECCQLVSTLMNLVVLAKGQAAHVLMEAAMPLLSVLEEKIKYLDVKAGLDANGQRKALNEVRGEVDDVRRAVEKSRKSSRSQPNYRNHPL